MAAGAVAFVNDLVGKRDDPNIDPEGGQLQALLEKAIVPMAVGGSLSEEAAEFFDERVEAAQAQEAEGAPIEDSWSPRPAKRTYVACDARYHCAASKANRPKGVVGSSPPMRRSGPARSAPAEGISYL